MDGSILSSNRDEWMDFGSYVSGKSFGSKDLERQKDKKKAAKEEEDRLRLVNWPGFGIMSYF